MFSLYAIKDGDTTSIYIKVLDQILDDFAELIRAHYDINDFADPSSTTDVCYLIHIYILAADEQYRRRSVWLVV